MRRFFTIFLCSILIFGINIYAQNGVNSPIKYKVEKVKVFDPKDIKPSFKPSIQNLEAPVPGGKSYRAALRALKNQSGKIYPRKSSIEKSQDSLINEAVILNSFSMQRLGKYPVNGELKDTLIHVSGGIPLDNTLAISNDNYLMCGINSKMYMHNLNLGLVPNDSNIAVVDFDDFAQGVGTSNPFDPKLLYDPEYDRFIATFLSGRNPSNSAIILAFSTSNDPTDPWNIYKVSGNPLDNNTWTDYPAIAMTENELFYTVNLLIPNVDWKVGFSRTIIWQFNKESGYNGEDELETNLWSEIATDGRYVRNLAPVQGGDSLHGPNMFFLSNRNFDLRNDSIFIVEVTSTIDDPDAQLKTSVVKSDEYYGLPPNGRQENSNPADTSDGFDTNDSRVLGSFKVGDEIQFVGNTKDFQTGNAAIYHGFIKNISTEPLVTGYIIGDNIKDFGYPNIVYSGTPSCNTSSLIAFNHTSPIDYAGVSAIKFNNGLYSDFTVLKIGEGYVDSWLSGSYERWGDYFGIQRKYNEPGVVWTAGFYGLAKNSSATWISELRDCGCFDVEVTENQLSNSNLCIGELRAEVFQAIEPINYNWNNNAGNTTAFDVNLCDYYYELTVSDDKQCEITLSDKGIKPLPKEDGVIYPNPAAGDVNVFFILEKAGYVEVLVYTIDGKIVYNVVDSRKAGSGKNVLNFSTEPLSSGSYIIKVQSEGKEVFTGKMIVP